MRLWKNFIDCFNCLPVAALVNDRIFCMHGGISSELENFDQIREIQRPVEVPDYGLLCDLLWADPCHEPGWTAGDRGVSVSFGLDVLEKLMERLDIDLICRGHQVDNA